MNKIVARKDRRVTFVISDAEYEDLESEAYGRIMSVSAFIRHAIRETIAERKRRHDENGKKLDEFLG